MSKLQEEVGRLVKEARSETGLTQKDLAEKTGVHWRTISDIERGERNVSVETLALLAEGLGKGLRDFIPED